MKLYRTGNGHFVEDDGSYYRVPLASWDALVTHDDLYAYLLSIVSQSQTATDFSPAVTALS